MNQIISSFSNSFKSQITDFLTKSPLLRMFARVTGFIRRERKLIARDALLTLILASFRSKPSSLVDMVSILKFLNPKARMTPQSLEERINNPGCFEIVKLFWRIF